MYKNDSNGVICVSPAATRSGAVSPIIVAPQLDTGIITAIGDAVVSTKYASFARDTRYLSVNGFDTCSVIITLKYSSIKIIIPSTPLNNNAPVRVLTFVIA